MSADPAALKALGVRTKAALRYFELVKFKSADHNVTCFLAVGKHALYLVRRSLGGLYPNDQGGQIYFAFIRSMEEDANDSTQLKLLLSESGARVWMSDTLLVSSKNRHALAQMIQVAWNTDYIFRFGQVKHLHLSAPKPKTTALAGIMAGLTNFFEGEKKDDPFKGFKEVLHSAYKFFIPESYFSQDQAGHFLHQNKLLELELSVQEPVSLADLEASHHNHIRWAGLECKRSISLSLRDVMITKSSSYHKRLNLSKDICAWTGWEITLRSEDLVMAIVLLRRQFLPPLADAAQDFSIRVTCQRWAVDEGQVEEESLLEEARLIADSTMPSNSTVLQQMYPDFVQAKLDTLVLPESAWAWTEKTLKMTPSCKKQACIFVNSILKALHEEHQLPSSDLLDDLIALAGGEEIPLVISPVEAAYQAKNLLELKEDDESAEVAMNAWLARVSRYFTYCLNGAFFEENFNLDHVCNAQLTQKPNQAKIHEALLFMLHARPKDLTQKWELKEFRELLLDPELFEKYEFNNHALQAFVEFGWLARQLKPPKKEEKISLEFTQFLCSLLLLPESSLDLKAAICRTITWACSGQIQVGILVPTLSAVLKQRNIFLKTCATVTLVNMTKRHEPVKDFLTRMDAPALLVEHLSIRDDDLIHYTLMLTTSLSRTTAQRVGLKKCGAVEELVHLLQMTYSESKDHLMVELASTIGQLCNEEDIRNYMAEAKVFGRLLTLYSDYPCSCRLRAKLMFAIRQFCVAGTSTSEALRDDVGGMLPQVIQELGEFVSSSQPFISLDDDQTDWLVSSVLLLYTLAIDRSLLEEMRDPELGFKEVLLKLRFSPLKELDVTRERIVELWEILRGDLGMG